MIQLSSKNDDSSLDYDVIITHQKVENSKICNFPSDINYNSETHVFSVVTYLIPN